MSPRTTRKVVVAVGMALALALVGFLVRQYTSPFPLGVPRDRALVQLFYAHRQTFEKLKEMADQDGQTYDLSVTRRAEYARLLSQIHRHMTVNVDQWRTAFWCAGGGILLSIGPRWDKGIAYLNAVPNRVGQIVRNLDKDPGHDDVYLVPIEGDWYVIYQRDDYD